MVLFSLLHEGLSSMIFQLDSGGDFCEYMSVSHGSAFCIVVMSTSIQNCDGVALWAATIILGIVTLRFGPNLQQDTEGNWPSNLIH